MMKTWFLLVWLFLMSPMLLAGQVIELIPMQYQLPQDIIPAIRPMLGKDDAINGMNNQLILKVEESRLPELRALIRQLDRPAAQLLIEVSHNGGARGHQSGYDVQGRLSTSGYNRANINIRDYSTRNRFGSSQTLHATEGRPALIRYGKSIPYQNYEIEVEGSRITQRQSTSFKHATTGFYVIPRLSGSRVSLEIQQHRNRYRHDGSLSVQDASTFVSGQLGDWIQLGAVGGTNANSASGMLAHSTRNLKNEQNILVRVMRK